MKIFRRSDFQSVPVNEIDRILAFDGLLREVSMPESIAILVSKWNHVFGSPLNSYSLYDSPNKTWTHTPEGSYRASDHWHWKDQRSSNGIACPTNHSVPINNWAIGIWHKDQYEIIQVEPKIGRHGQKSMNRLIFNHLYKDPKFRSLQLINKF